MFFFGLLQPLGAIMPIAEAQGKWVAEYLTGHYALPDAPAMQRDMETERKAMFERYVPSRRHTMQVDFDDYMVELEKELAAGRKRAAPRRQRAAGSSAPLSGVSPSRGRPAARAAVPCPSTASSRCWSASASAASHGGGKFGPA